MTEELWALVSAGHTHISCIPYPRTADHICIPKLRPFCLHNNDNIHISAQYSFRKAFSETLLLPYPSLKIFPVLSLICKSLRNQIKKTKTCFSDIYYTIKPPQIKVLWINLLFLLFSLQTVYNLVQLYYCPANLRRFLKEYFFVR